MKTPDEIKKGLETCIGKCIGNKPHCPYHSCGDGCMDSMNRDALALIQQLEADLKQEKADHQHTYECAEAFQKENAELLEKSKHLEQERDAAIFDLTHYSMCKPCKHFSKDIKCLFTDDCLYGTKGHFEWRGPCEENTENP